MSKFTKEFELSDDTLVEVEFEGYYEFHPGKYSGPPENCYPDEEDWEIEEITILTKDVPVELDAELAQLIDSFIDSKEARELLIDNQEEADYGE